MKWPVSLSQVPPGEWRYNQNGVQFGPSPQYMAVAVPLSDFRKGNNLDRSDLRSCVMDLVTYTVSRLPQNSEFLYETNQSVEELTPAVSSKGGGCAGCGASVP